MKLASFFNKESSMGALVAVAVLSAIVIQFFNIGMVWQSSQNIFQENVAALVVGIISIIKSCGLAFLVVLFAQILGTGAAAAANAKVRVWELVGNCVLSIVIYTGLGVHEGLYGRVFWWLSNTTGISGEGSALSQIGSAFLFFVYHILAHGACFVGILVGTFILTFVLDIIPGGSRD